MADVSASFTGSIPEYYDSCLGPAWFDAFGEDLARRLPTKPPGDVLEIACGTGLVTRRLRERLDPSVRLTATDLSAAMLGPGGIFLFNVWDRIEENPCAANNAQIVEGLFPGDPELRFRTPFEMHDLALLRRLLAGARFGETRIEKKRIQIDRVSARSVATGQIRGTPRSLLIEKRGVSLDDVIDKVTAALALMGGADPLRAPANAIMVEASAIA